MGLIVKKADIYIYPKIPLVWTKDLTDTLISTKGTSPHGEIS